jgi:hypothetical protein
VLGKIGWIKAFRPVLVTDRPDVVNIDLPAKLVVLGIEAADQVKLTRNPV